MNFEIENILKNFLAWKFTFPKTICYCEKDFFQMSFWRENSNNLKRFWNVIFGAKIKMIHTIPTVKIQNNLEPTLKNLDRHETALAWHIFFQNSFLVRLWFENWLKLIELLSISLKELFRSVFVAYSCRRSVLKKIRVKRKRSHVVPSSFMLALICIIISSMVIYWAQNQRSRNVHFVRKLSNIWLW